MAKRIMWTERQKALALLLQEGKSYTEVKDAGFSDDMFSKVSNAIKRGELPPDMKVGDGKEKKPESKMPGRQLELGKIVVTPENWGMSQYGAILILDTYTQSKNDPSVQYVGTVGQFLCDVVAIYRKIMGYEEVKYVRAEFNRSDGSGEDGEGGSEQDEKHLIESAVG